MNKIRFYPRFAATAILVIIAVLVILSMSSCGTYNKLVNKNKHKEEIKTENESTKTKDTETETITTRTITEEFDKTIETPEKKASDSTGLNNFLNGGEIKFEDDDLEFITKLDTATKTVKTSVVKKKKSVQVPGKRTIQENVKQKEKSSEVEDKKETSSTKTLDKTKDKKVDVDTSLPWYLWLFIIVALFILVYMVLKRYKII